MGILSRMMERRSTLENPSTNLWEFFTRGGSTAAGARVTNATALNLSAVWAAVRVLTDAVAVLGCVTYERLPGGKRRADEHPAYPLLKLRPNPYTTAFVFWETVVGHLATWGNAYAEKELDGAGRVVGLWPLRPDRTRITWDERTGRRVYVTSVKGQDVPLPASRVLHIPGFGFDGVQGYNPIRIARESLGLTKAAEQYGASFFGQGAKPAGVLQHPETLSDTGEQRLRQSWEELHTGLTNAHRIAILEEGMTYTQVGVPPEEAQFLETRKFQTAEVARWFKVPPHLIGDLERATFSNIEHQDLEFLKYTLLPWVRRIEHVVNWDVFPVAERGRYFAEFNVEDLLRGDSAARAQFYRELWGIGALSVNDILAKENMNPVEGGDTRFVPVNMIPLELAGDYGASLVGTDEEGGEEPPAPGPEARAREERGRRSLLLRDRHALAQLPVFADRARAVVDRELGQVRRAIKKALDGRDATDLRAWLDEFYESHGRWVAERFAPVIRAYAATVRSDIGVELGQDIELTPELETFEAEYVAAVGTRWAADSKGQLLALLRDTEPDDIEAVLTERLDEWEEKRAGKAAKRETYRAENALARTIYAAVGITQLRWAKTGTTTCPFCTRMNGKVVGITGAFLEEGHELESGEEGVAPLSVRSKITHPPLHGGCDCHVVASL
jgi:HK97 family phage portal protein